jgi:hypothetical protein
MDAALVLFEALPPWLTDAEGGAWRAQKPLLSRWHHWWRSHTAWLPQPCRWNCMAAASMQFRRAAWGGKRGISGQESWLGSHKYQE